MNDRPQRFGSSHVKHTQQGIAQGASSSSAPDVPAPSPAPLNARSGWIPFVGPLLIAAGAFVFAWLQVPNPSLGTGAGPAEWQWWIFPYERNAIFNRERNPGPPEFGALNAVRFSERGDRAFVVGEHGIIWYSNDRGDSWRLARGNWPTGPSAIGEPTQLDPALTEDPAKSIFDPDSESGQSESERMTDLQGAGIPTNSSQAIVLDKFEAPGAYPDIDRLREQAGTGGNDGSNPPDTVPEFISVDADEYGEFVAALADDGTVAISVDGGESWKRKSGPASRDVDDIVVADGGRLLTVSFDSRPEVAVSRDRGESWELQSTRGVFRAMAASGGGSWFVGASVSTGPPRVILSVDNLNDSNEVSPGGFGEVTDVETDANGNYAYAIERGLGTSTLRYLDADEGTWQILYQGIGASGLGISGDGMHLAIRAGNRLVVSGDGGQTFRSIRVISTGEILQDMAVSSSGDVLVVTRTIDKEGYELRQLAPGARQWMRITDSSRYSWFPAPWLWTILMLCGVAILRAWQLRRRSQTQQVEGIANIAVSDTPLSWNDADHLDFKPLAMSVSAFVRNENTQAPLTIAITGLWGTGKSSLMRLIEHDLKINRFRPVWFNAWHVQEEQQLLAALLTAVRDQAAPPWWTPLGLRFRARLLIDRGGTAWLKLAVLVTALSAIVAAVTSGQLERLLLFGDSDQWPRTLAALIGTGGGATLLIGLMRALTTFREQPAKLVASVAQSASVATLDAQLSFRHRFAREFALITRALEPYTLTIFIDDLDRCLPKQVVDTLEAVNFLTTAGQCVVIFGMARAPVEAAISETYRSQFKFDKPQSTSPGVANLPFDEGYAHHYLEKLINIEIPVPRHGADRSAKLTEPAPAVATTTRARIEATAFRHRGWAAVVLLLAPLWLGHWLSERLVPAHVDYGTRRIEQAGATEGKGPSAVESPSTTEKSAMSSETAPATRPAPLSAGVSISGFQSSAGSIRIIVVVALLGGVIGFVFRERKLQRREILRDSEGFRRALSVWSKAVAQQHQGNPRALKRFVNWLRYLAMAGRIRHSGEPLPEHILVMLASLHRMEIDVEAALGDRRALQSMHSYSARSPENGNAADSRTPEQSQDAISERQHVIDLVERAFDEMGRSGLSPFPAKKEDVVQFRRLVAGVVE